MKYKEFVEDLGGALAGGVDRAAAAIADLPGVLQDAYKETKAKIMQMNAEAKKILDYLSLLLHIVDQNSWVPNQKVVP